ncbi:MAG: hypothetical protein R2809_05235 [Flavobacteriales bacterium]
MEQESIAEVNEAGERIRGLESGQLITAVILVQLIAVPGAYAFSFLSRKIGNSLTLNLA